MFRFAKTFSLCLALFAGVFNTSADAAWFGLPRVLKSQIEHINFQAPVLAPFAYSNFCVKYKAECRVYGRAFRRPHPIAMTEGTWNSLVSVNRQVNEAIVPHGYVGNVSYKTWTVRPKRGDCNDYAVTKRHELLARGWPTRALLLAEVVTTWGEHHLVLVVRMASGDVVLDNLTPEIRNWSKANYQWVRIQTPNDPMAWSTVRSVNA